MTCIFFEENIAFFHQDEIYTDTWASVGKIYILSINTSIVKHIVDVQVSLLHAVNILVPLPECNFHIH